MKLLAQRIVKIFLSFFAIYLVLGILIWLCSPMLVRKVSNSLLEAHGVHTTPETLVRLNPFTSNITVRDCALQNDDDAQLAIEELTLSYRFWPLLRKSLVIEELGLKGAKLNIRQFRDRLVIGGIALIQSDGEAKPLPAEGETTSPASYALTVDQLVFEDFEIFYFLDDGTHSATIKNFSIEKLRYSGEKTVGNVALLLEIANGSIDFTSSIDADPERVKIQTAFASENIELSEFSTWLPPQPQLHTAILNLGFKLEAELSTTQQRVTVRDMQFQLDDKSKDTNLLRFAAEKLDIPEIIQNENAITIQQIDLAKPELAFTFNSASKPEMQPEEMATTDTQASENSESDAQLIKIDSFTFSKPGEFAFEDLNPASKYSQKIIVETLEIRNIDTGDPQAVTTFTLAGKDENYFNFSFSGDIRVASDKTNLGIKGSLAELSLPPLNYYSKQALGLGLERGHLNSDIDISVTDDQLGGELALHLKGVSFSSKDEVDALSAIDHSAMPLNVALGYLKDKNDNIELKIPLSGDVNDPAFGTQYITSLIVKKAVMSQAKSYLINTFLPYANVITVAMIAGEQALKVRFEDLPYSPGQIQISEDQYAFVDQLTALLNKKTDLRIHACAYATGKEGESREARRTLSTERARAFKKYLVEQKSISSERILQCEPKIDTRENAKPRIEIGE